jgi:hypothetical protein
LYSRLPRSSVLPWIRIFAEGILAQILGVRLDQAAVLVLHVELVQVVEDRALRQRAVRVLERGERARLRLADVDRGDLRRLHRARLGRRLAAALVLDLGGGLVLGVVEQAAPISRPAAQTVAMTMERMVVSPFIR